MPTRGDAQQQEHHRRRWLRAASLGDGPALRCQSRIAPNTNTRPLAAAVSMLKSLYGFGGQTVASSFPVLAWRGP